MRTAEILARIALSTFLFTAAVTWHINIAMEVEGTMPYIAASLVTLVFVVGALDFALFD